MKKPGRNRLYYLILYHTDRTDGVFQVEFTEAELELVLWAIEEPRA